MKASELKLGLIPYGVVYLVLPEQERATRRRDLESIDHLGFNTVVLWPPISRWDGDPPGAIAFDSVDEVMDICAELGLKVILELQGQDHNHEALPEMLEFMANAVDGHTGDVAPLNHPEVRKSIVAYMRAVAEHFKGHPALLAYDVFNEVHYTGFDEWTAKEFVSFLRDQYGEIQELNRKWATFFPDFDTIEKWVELCRRRTWSSGVAGRDWYRFRPHNFAARLREWGDAIRDVDPDAVIVADILGCDTMHNRNGRYGGATDWATAAAVDVFGLSCWANMFNPDWWLKDCYAWPHMWRQQLSAGRRKQVIISELMTPNRSMFPEEHSSMSDQIRLWGYQAFFNGLKGVIYWKYRPFTRGVQVAGRGLTDYEGTPNEFGQQAAEVARFVQRHADELAGATPDDAGCALLFDQNAQDLYQALQGWDPDFYTDAHRGYFRGLWRHGVSPSFITPEDITRGVPEDISALIVPCNVSVSLTTAQALTTFVRKGGFLLTEGRFGLLDEDGNLWPRVPGAGLRDTFGIGERRLLSDAADTVSIDGENMDLPDYLQELVLADDVEQMLRTTSGHPALVSTRLGAGTYVHVPFLLGRKLERRVSGAEEVFDRAYARLARGLRPVVPVIEKPGRVDVSTLSDAARETVLVGIVNYAEQDQGVRLAWSNEPLSVEGDTGCRAELRGGALHVSVPRRSVCAMFLGCPGGDGR